MHEVRAKGILSSRNGMNIYRGCSHGCIYCDSRSECYQIKHDFEDIEVKVNAPELLEESLRRKRKKCMISTGSMTDPYIPLERQLNNMRKCLEIVDHYGFGISIQTKSNLILRDLELLKSINEKSKCVVEMTLTTYDESLCKKIEPGVCTTKERFEVLKTMRDNGIPTVVWLCPILPFINDTEENIKGILAYCIEADVKAILCFNMGLTLRKGNREYFYYNLDRLFPGLKEKYISQYGYSYQVVSRKNKELMKMAGDICSQHGMIFGTDEVFEYLHKYEEKNDYEQMRLF
ncbi:MAG: radical SAM protein [Halanaerobiales bacterium]